MEDVLFSICCLYIAKAYEKIAHRRYDFIQQYTASLVRENEVSSFAVKECFCEFSLYEGRWHGKDVLTIAHFVASSKTYHVCGHKQEKMPLSVRSCSCVGGLSPDRDIDAANVDQEASYS